MIRPQDLARGIMSTARYAWDNAFYALAPDGAVTVKVPDGVPQTMERVANRFKTGATVVMLKTQCGFQVCRFVMLDGHIVLSPMGREEPGRP